MIQFVKQEVIPWGPCPSDEASMLRWIELAGRVAYKSEDKITDDSAIGFVGRMKNSGHYSVLEHSNIVLVAPGRWSSHDNAGIYKLFADRAAFHRIRRIKSLQDRRYPIATVIAGNVRSWLETLAFWPSQQSNMMKNQLSYALNSRYPNLFEFTNNTLLFVEYPCVCVSNLEEQLLLQDESDNYDLPVYTFKIICDRGISHEIVRHRVLSYTQESTRYVNYGNKGGTFIIPDHLENEGFDSSALVSDIPLDVWLEWREYETLCNDTYSSYSRLLSRYHRKPQIARDLLPNLLKTEIVVSGRWSGWKHFIELRDSPAAHPRIQKIAKDIRAYFSGVGLEV
jgi:thymidylate synthase (FAD)